MTASSAIWCNVMSSPAAINECYLYLFVQLPTKACGYEEIQVSTVCRHTICM